jgi:hypothetical protein
VNPLSVVLELKIVELTETLTVYVLIPLLFISSYGCVDLTDGSLCINPSSILSLSMDVLMCRAIR